MSSSNIAKVVDKLAQLQLSGAQWQILAAIYGSQLRQGDGEWQNQPCLMSFGGLKGATDVSLRHVAREVRDLLGRNILRRIPSGQNYLFRFNFDYSTWVMSKTKPTPQVLGKNNSRDGVLYQSVAVTIEELNGEGSFINY